MGDPSIERFRRVIASAYGSLEARRQEVNDLNVFPVADGDTGENMALTMRALMEELDRLDDGRSLDEIGRTELVSALARAALLGARGNSGVILSQIVRGAAEELASRPGELVDPVLVASAFANAADAAYASVTEPVEGTMLTVFREIAHSVSRQLAHMEPSRQRLGPDVTPEEQDAVIADVLEQAIADGEKAVERTPEQLKVLADSGVVDAGGYGLVLILAGVLAALRGEEPELPDIGNLGGAPTGRSHHVDTRFRYCTNFIVSGTGLESRHFIPLLEQVGDSVLVVGDKSTLKVHVHTDEPESAMAIFAEAGTVDNLDVADMQQQIKERNARLSSGRTGVVAVAAGLGMEDLMSNLGAFVVTGGETMNPSTMDLLAGIREVTGDEVVVLPNSSNVQMAAEEAANLSDREVIVVPSRSQQEGLLALVEFDTDTTARSNADRFLEVLSGLKTGGIAEAARDDAAGRFCRGDAVGFLDEEIVVWGDPVSTLSKTLTLLADGAEIITVISGQGAPASLAEVEGHAPDGVELELHEGGQPSWWWLLAAQ